MHATVNHIISLTFPFLSYLTVVAIVVSIGGCALILHAVFGIVLVRYHKRTTKVSA